MVDRKQMIAAMAALCLVGCDDDSKQVAPEQDAGLEVHMIETRLGLQKTAAGVENKVTCTAYAANGDQVSLEDMTFEVKPETGVRKSEDGGNLIGVLPGSYEVLCKSPSLGLADEAGSLWQVEAGPAVSLAAEIAQTELAAGDTLEVDCIARDNEGNRVSLPEAQVVVTPHPQGIFINGNHITAFQAGDYEVTCAQTGILSEGGAAFSVLAGAPGELVAKRVPDLDHYRMGDTVQLAAEVRDAYGNPLSGVNLRYASEENLTVSGAGRFQLMEEGLYHISVEVTDPSFDGRELKSSFAVAVQGGGEAIRCLSPALGESVLEGQNIKMTGMVTDLDGFQTLLHEGEAVQVGQNGHFELWVTPKYGLNIHHFERVSDQGETRPVDCMFMAAAGYHDEHERMEDSIQLSIGNTAIDDGYPSEPIGSLADLIRVILESPQLIETLDTTLKAQNPILPMQCLKEVLGACIARAEVTYNGLQLSRQSNLSVKFVGDGIRIQVTLNGIELDASVTGTVNTSGKVSLAYMTLDLTFGVGLTGGRPSIALLRQDEITLGEMSFQFEESLLGEIVSGLANAFEGTIRSKVTDALSDFFGNQVNALLSSLLGSLDLSNLNLNFTIPAFGNLAETELGLSVGFSRLETAENQIRLGLSLDVDGPLRNPAEHPGIATFEDERWVNQYLGQTENLGAAVYAGLINLVLHRLWRTGIMQIEDIASLTDKLPAGSEVSIQVLAPPVARWTQDQTGLELHVGPVVGALKIPPMISSSMQMQMGLVARLPAELSDEGVLSLGGEEGVTFSELSVRLQSIEKTPSQLQTLENFLQTLLKGLIADNVNPLLPEIQIPALPLPEALTVFGLPEGTTLSFGNYIFETESAYGKLRAKLQ